MTNPRRPTLEVIATTAEDASAAERGGADRLEIVRDIDVGGLTPELDGFQAIRAATNLPLRVMLRTNSGFRISPAELEALCLDASNLRAAGADQFVLGFLDDSGALDVESINTLVAAIAPSLWTLHHAFDHARGAQAAWTVARDLPGIDCILSGGIRGNLELGLTALCERADWQDGGPRWLAGGGLVLDYIEPLRRAGIRQFHIGRAARHDHSWTMPLSEDAVRCWRAALDW